jgi:hypothetical protein
MLIEGEVTRMNMARSVSGCNLFETCQTELTNRERKNTCLITLPDISHETHPDKVTFDGKTAKLDGRIKHDVDQINEQQLLQRVA